ncbi:hypothetical protein NDR87_26335 [Nocardia sp. CDC159]|uniref:Uncharacterized protein n=1 Tax=Nocardia pulmonis TaxID=2951408 RepID=A0A9X2E7C4_9NOCA|nr:MULTISPECIES: hypothetical protein [Nocardia]MCM6774966.1 hypothetical protein [Nocardia pulmonis]MCM6789897.1 hypothetical protein [Nocardia sp. CDC159]
MTGTTEKKTPPRSDQEWARDIQQRVDNVEHPTSLRAGDWVLSTQEGTGSLIASHVDGGSVVLAKKPESTEDPDKVADSGLPFVKLVRNLLQSAAANTVTPISWNAVVHQTGDWNITAPASTIIIPTDGIYLVLFRLMWETNGQTTTKAIVTVDGTAVMTQEFNPHNTETWWQSEYTSDTFPFNAGQVLTCQAYSGGTTRNFGPSSPDPNSVTSLSLIRLPVEVK